MTPQEPVTLRYALTLEVEVEALPRQAREAVEYAGDQLVLDHTVYDTKAGTRTRVKKLRVNEVRRLRR